MTHKSFIHSRLMSGSGEGSKIIKDLLQDVPEKHVTFHVSTISTIVVTYLAVIPC